MCECVCGRAYVRVGVGVGGGWKGGLQGGGGVNVFEHQCVKLHKSFPQKSTMFRIFYQGCSKNLTVLTTMSTA